MKAIFLDRDGIVNELVFNPEHGLFDSPYTAGQYKLVNGICHAINKFRKAGFKVAIVSNQPGVAKGYITMEQFENIRKKMVSDLAEGKATIDGEYYCFHHPDASVPEYRIACNCRKPKPGLLLKAARDWKLDLSQSWMIGDNITDIQAGSAAGCKTVLIGKAKCEVCRLLDEKGVHPDLITQDIIEASNIITEE